MREGEVPCFQERMKITNHLHSERYFPLGKGQECERKQTHKLIVILYMAMVFGVRLGCVVSLKMCIKLLRLHSDINLFQVFVGLSLALNIPSKI